MRVFNSRIVPKNVKGGPLGFFNIHSGAKHQKKTEGGVPLKTFKKFEKKSFKAKKGGGQSLIAPKNWKGEPNVQKVVHTR